VFDGFDDIYVKAALLDNFDKKNTIGGLAQGMNWFFFAFYRCLLSFFYPDNFILQLLKIIAKTYLALWLFPLYLLLLIFSSSQLFGRQHPFEGKGLNADTYSLLIPQFFDNNALTVLVFLGGFSAAISMIIVSSISLSTMLSNNLLIPYGFQVPWKILRKKK
jgi:hypothetical protein